MSQPLAANEFQLMLDVVRLAPVAILVCDPSNVVRFGNPAASELLNISEDFFLGQPIEQSIPELNFDSLVASQAVRVTPSNSESNFSLDCTIQKTQFEDQTWTLLYLQDAASHRRRELILEYEASTDPLSELANRRAFQRALELHQAESLTLAIFDVDGFKCINDQFGHPIGDDVIQALGAMLTDHFQGVALVVARLGGDEFGVLLRTVGDESNLDKLDAFRASLVARQLTELPELAISISVGVAVSRQPSIEPRTLLTVADKALYLAKSDGRNCLRSQTIELD